MLSDKDQTITPSGNGRYYTRPDAESPAAADLRRKKRNKCILFFALFAIFQTGVILIFSLIVMKVRTPKLRLRSAALSNLAAGTPANPLLRSSITAEISLRNPNFGQYKFHNTTVEFFYSGATAGRAAVRGSSVGWRSTRRVGFNVDLDLPASDELARDLSTGIVTLDFQAKMKGRVDLIFVMRKKRSTAMNCSVDVVIATRAIGNIIC
ncbi:Unknown protein [Striga hermonthica]|uniref:Late embryogenesis abundant protein LEA-2 subgroup domain-containing protein n=1 Tax=Striga hermonthica TaxID=68872 RepID=A0A9N7MTX8_STRHE|nr:Unknown protein [Striga hermonthica]